MTQRGFNGFLLWLSMALGAVALVFIVLDVGLRVQAITSPAEASVDLGEFVAVTIATLAGVDADVALGALTDLQPANDSVEADSAAADLLTNDEYVARLVEINAIADAMIERALAIPDLSALEVATDGPWGDEHGLPTPAPLIVTPKLLLEPDLALILQRLEARILALEAADVLGYELDIEPLTGPDVLQILHRQAKRIAALEAVLEDPIPDCIEGVHWTKYPLHICTTYVDSE